MPWDPSRRPRKPRLRAHKRKVREPADGLSRFAIPPSELSDDDVAAIVGHLPGPWPNELLGQTVRSLSSLYAHAQLEAEPARPYIRYELRLLAHLAWRLPRRSEWSAEHKAELLELLRKMDHTTNERLLSAIAVLNPGQSASGLLYGGKLDLELIQGSASLADTEFVSRGDYRNAALHKIIAYLLRLYRACADDRPTFHRVLSGPSGLDASARTIAASPCAPFIFEFFRRVDPSLGEGTVTNALDKGLSAMRAGTPTD